MLVFCEHGNSLGLQEENSMSNVEQEEMPGPTKPSQEHEWLQNLVGEWRVETEMMMPDGSKETSTGSETVRSLGGLWAIGEGKSTMPGGDVMEMHNALGYDVSFKEYRGCWYASVSSHLW